MKSNTQFQGLELEIATGPVLQVSDVCGKAADEESSVLPWNSHHPSWTVGFYFKRHKNLEFPMFGS